MTTLRTNKRGLDYIDWSMSLGLFLVAVIALFAFLKPGIQQPYDGQNLIQIIEQNFFEETGTILKQTPVFIYHLADKYNPGGLDATVDIDIDSTWYIVAVQPPSTNFFSYVQQRTAVTWDCPSTCDKKNFTISWAPNTQNSADPSIELDCTPSLDMSSCNAVLGSTLTQEGLERTAVDSIKTEIYQTLKTRWNYPQTKGFAIYLDDTLEIGITPPAEGNTIVKEIKYWNILGSDRIPVNVRIMVW
jgi:hypothetical protein